MEGKNFIVLMYRFLKIKVSKYLLKAYRNLQFFGVILDFTIDIQDIDSLKIHL